MSERSPNHEPAPQGERFLDTYEEYQLYDPRGMPGGKSVSDRLTERYGEEGVGWRAEKHMESEAAQTLGQEATRLAREAQHLEWAGFGHVDVEGNPVPKDIAKERPLILYDVYVKDDDSNETEEL